MQRFVKKLTKLFDWEWVYTFQMDWTQQQRRKQLLSCGIMVTYFKKLLIWILIFFFFKVALVLKKEILRIKD